MSKSGVSHQVIGISEGELGGVGKLPGRALRSRMNASEAMRERACRCGRAGGREGGEGAACKTHI